MKTRKSLHSSVMTLSSNAEISLALWNAKSLAPVLKSALTFIFSPFLKFYWGDTGEFNNILKIIHYKQMQGFFIIKESNSIIHHINT